MKKIFFLFSFLLISNSYAGTDWVERGNAGFAIQCDSGRFRILDLFEAEQDGLALDQEHSSSVEERFNHLISKISQHNPSRANLYSQWYKDFYSGNETKFIPNVNIQPIDNNGYTPVPKNCQLFQVIFQRQPSEFNSARYNISKDLWDQLSPYDQAGLLLHEFILRELSTPPSAQPNSEISRKFNGWLNSTDSSNITLRKYLEKLRNMFIVRADYQTWPILLAYKDESQQKWIQLPLGFRKDDTVQQVTLEAKQEPTFVVGNQEFGTTCTTANNLKTSGLASFYPSGKLEYIHQGYIDSSAKPYIENCAVGTHFVESHLSITSQGWHFREDGSIIMANTNYFGDQAGAVVLNQAGNRTIAIRPGMSSPYIGFEFTAKGFITTMRFTGDSCRDSFTNSMIIYFTNVFADKTDVITWDYESFDKKLKSLKVCEF